MAAACGKAEPPDHGGQPGDGPAPAGRPQQPVPGPLRLHGLDVVDARTAFVVGSIETPGGGEVVLGTTDGGASWRVVLRAPDNTLVGLDFVDASTGVAIDEDGGIFTTVDGGATWTGAPGPGRFRRRVASGVKPDASGPGLFASHAVDTRTGWAGGREVDAVESSVERPVIYRTSDGGASWRRATIENAPQAAVTAFASFGGVGYAVAGTVDDEALGVVLVTRDGGATWRTLESGIKQILTGIAAAAAERVVVVGQTPGRADDGPGDIFLSGDGGASWRSVSSPGVPLAAVRFADGVAGWAVGGSKILRTVDGGATWTEQSPGDLAGGQVVQKPPIDESIDENEPYFSGITLISADRGYAPSDEGMYEYRRR